MAKSSPQSALGAHFFTVRNLVAYIRDLFTMDPTLTDVWVAGEITELTQSAAGHAYFTVRDAQARIPAVMFRSALQRQTLPLVVGHQALVHGSVTLYEQRSIVQLIADMVLPEEAGQLRAQFEALRRRLEDEGLFARERKRPLSRLPRRIGVITSETGAVLHDMLNVWRRRYRSIEIVLAPSAMQGDEAPRQIANAFRWLNAYHEAREPLDLIILARGGGSPEELAVFNDEIVARAIFAAVVPVVSAIGHETDETIADYVADLRAPTPSAAAELVVPDSAELGRELDQVRDRLGFALRRQLTGARAELDSAARQLERRAPGQLVDQYRRAVDELAARSTRAVTGRVELARTRVSAGRSQLEALGPGPTLRRGYSIFRRASDGLVVTDSAQLAAGDEFAVRFAHGGAAGAVREVELEGGHGRVGTSATR